MNTPQEIAQALEAAIIASNKHTNALKRELYELNGNIQRSGSTTLDKKAARKAAQKELYATKTGLTIHKLRLAGNSVKVTHIRYTPVKGKRTEYVNGVATEIPFVTLQPVPSYLRAVYDFDGKGGATYIVITTPEKRVYAVASHCHELDSFDYKLGVRNALNLLNQIDAELLLSSTPVVEQLVEATVG